MSKSPLGRRELLKYTAAAGLIGALDQLHLRRAYAAEKITFAGWTAAVDQVKAHITAFEKETGITVDYVNAPWAQYRDAMIPKLAANAPIDVMWVSDTWLAEWAEAGWLQPIDGFKELTRYNADAMAFATESMTYHGRQYGLTYYAGFMGFLYNDEMLRKAGITAPPETWDQVTEHALRIKKAGLSEYPMMLPLANETWLIEFLSAMVYSYGGRFVDDKQNAVMHLAKGGALAPLKWIIDAVHTHKIVSPAAVTTGELIGLKAVSSGAHAMTLLQENRLRMLNDPKQSQVAGRIKLALMPKGGSDGSHATVAWVRFYGLTKHGAGDRKRAAAAARFIEWFGGKAKGEYKFQKILYTDLFGGFVVKPLLGDPELQNAMKPYADLTMVSQQFNLAKKKDVMSAWFGEWNEANGRLWQSAILRKDTPEAALRKSADGWTRLKKQHG
jgi:multiple sugar transport system substrate-binding protein